MAYIEEKIKHLENWFSLCPGALVAFSAGVDSSLVAYIAHVLLGDNMLAVIADSPSLKRKDLEEGRDFASRYNIPLEVIETKELESHDYAKNEGDRCYFCKSHLYTDMTDLSREYPGWWILNGANWDDQGDYRPGMRAAAENAVRSPLLDCHITKQVVRDITQYYKLDCWNKPASPCMSSRIPYGQVVTKEKLSQIETAENFIHSLGFENVRVRHYGDNARIEVPAFEVETLRTHVVQIEEFFRNIGFSSYQVDEEGFVSGKLNRALV